MTKRNPYKIADKKITHEQLEISKSLGLSRDIVRKRIIKGWTVEQACTLPKGTQVKKQGRIKGRKKEEVFKKTKPQELVWEIGRIKYMMSQDLLNPPCITSRMKKRAKEYGINIDEIKPIKVDLKGIAKAKDFQAKGIDDD